jgi:capsular exopolysaccharide synthesis family protein
LIAITATIVTFILPESYSSTARIEINQDSGDIASMGGVQASSMMGYDAYFLMTEFQKMQSEKVLGRVILTLDLNNKWGVKYAGGVPYKTEDTMQMLKGKLSLSQERNTKLIDVTVYSEDKNDAADLANGIAEAYRDYRLALRNTNTMAGIRALQEEFELQQKRIQAAQTNVDQLREQFKIVDVDPNSTAPSPTLTQEMLQQLHNQQIEDNKAYMKLKVTLDDLKELQATNPAQLRDVLPTVSGDGELSGLLSKLHEAEQVYVTKTNSYSPANPEILTSLSMITKLNEQIDERVNGVMIGLSSQVKSTKASLDELTARLEAAKTNDFEEAIRGQPYWEAKRELESWRDFQKVLQAKISEEKLNLGIPKTSMVTIIDQAKPGKNPVKPNKTLNIVLGLVVGLIVGVGLAFFIEYLDTSVKTIDDVERALQAPVLGVIPQNVGYLVDEGAESQHAEAYRVLRTNLLFSRKDDRLNTIVVVSAGAGEGKSTTALNLATVFAQAGHRVLLVDSDLRRPTLHKALHLSNTLGLTNYLLKQNTLDEVIQNTAVPTLQIMASGKLPSSSMNILGSAQMKDMVGELKRRYDFIFFDSPPIMGVSDAAILASEMDIVVQVIQYRRYPQPMNIRAKQLIEKVGGNLVGIVLNNINMSQDESYYYYSGYYHGYYYYSRNEEEQEAEKTGQGSGGDTDRTGIKQKY